jgi:cytochrome b6-f complex iron-sulfur subunit
MIRVELYTRRDCSLCDEAKAVLLGVRRDIPFELREIDIESAPELLQAYGERIPFVTIDGRPAFKFRVEEGILRRRLAGAARGRGEPAPERGRRSFLGWLLGTSTGALLVSIFYPIVRYLIPPKAAESTAARVTLDLDAASITANSGRIFRFGAQPGILLRTPAGDLRAYSAVCTHLACTVQYRADLQHIWCACHNGHFDPYTGANIGGPPPRPLDTFTAQARGDKIVVSRSAAA